MKLNKTNQLSDILLYDKLVKEHFNLPKYFVSLFFDGIHLKVIYHHGVLERIFCYTNTFEREISLDYMNSLKLPKKIKSQELIEIEGIIDLPKNCQLERELSRSYPTVAFYEMKGLELNYFDSIRFLEENGFSIPVYDREKETIDSVLEFYVEWKIRPYYQHLKLEGIYIRNNEVTYESFTSPHIIYLFGSDTKILEANEIKKAGIVEVKEEQIEVVESVIEPVIKKQEEIEIIDNLKMETVEYIKEETHKNIFFFEPVHSKEDTIAISKIKHFISKKGMDIKIDDRLLNDLYEEQFLLSVPDLYDLKKHEDAIIALGLTSSDKLKKILRDIEKSKTAKVSNVLFAMSIPLNHEEIKMLKMHIPVLNELESEIEIIQTQIENMETIHDYLPETKKVGISEEQLNKKLPELEESVEKEKLDNPIIDIALTEAVTVISLKDLEEQLLTKIDERTKEIIEDHIIEERKVDSNIAEIIEDLESQIILKTEENEQKDNIKEDNQEIKKEDKKESKKQEKETEKKQQEKEKEKKEELDEEEKLEEKKETKPLFLNMMRLLVGSSLLNSLQSMSFFERPTKILGSNLSKEEYVENLIDKYSTFDPNIIGPTIAKLMSVYEQKDFVYTGGVLMPNKDTIKLTDENIQPKQHIIVNEDTKKHEPILNLGAFINHKEHHNLVNIGETKEPKEKITLLGKRGIQNDLEDYPYIVDFIDYAATKKAEKDEYQINKVPEYGTEEMDFYLNQFLKERKIDASKTIDIRTKKELERQLKYGKVKKRVLEKDSKED